MTEAVLFLSGFAMGCAGVLERSVIPLVLVLWNGLGQRLRGDILGALRPLSLTPLLTRSAGRARARAQYLAGAVGAAHARRRALLPLPRTRRPDHRQDAGLHVLGQVAPNGDDGGK